MSTAKQRDTKLRTHQREWESKSDLFLNSPHRRALPWLHEKRAQFGEDPLFRTSRVSLTGLFDAPKKNSTSTRVLFIAKCPRGQDQRKHKACQDPSWAFLRTWVQKNARGHLNFVYLFPRAIYTERTVNKETGEQETYSPLRNEHMDTYGWYMRAIVHALRPDIIVPMGSYVVRAALCGFRSTGMKDLGSFKDLCGHVFTRAIDGPLNNRKKRGVELIVRVIPFLDPFQSQHVRAGMPYKLFRELRRRQEENIKERSHLVGNGNDGGGEGECEGKGKTAYGGITDPDEVFVDCLQVLTRESLSSTSTSTSTVGELSLRKRARQSGGDGGDGDSSGRESHTFFKHARIVNPWDEEHANEFLHRVSQEQHE